MNQSLIRCQLRKRPRRSKYQIFLQILKGRNYVFSTLFKQSLEVIGEGIYQCSQFIEQAVRSGDTDYAQVVADDENEIIENLLGASFVLCQREITCLVSLIIHLHDVFEEDEKRPLGNLSKLSPNYEKKETIMKLGQNLDNSGYTDIQGMDAFSNYFKHRDEWNSDWEKLKKDNQKSTAGIIKALGASHESRYNLMHGAKVLGNSQYYDMDVFLDRLGSWRDNLECKYRQQLQIEGVILE